MALLRLWWIPYGETADRGAYVKYPVDDLLAVLALESQRHRCMVIGEDLGTVPVEIVGKLRDSGVYSYKVLYFESDGEHHFRAPQVSGAGDGDHHHPRSTEAAATGKATISRSATGWAFTRMRRSCGRCSPIGNAPSRAAGRVASLWLRAAEGGQEGGAARHEPAA